MSQGTSGSAARCRGTADLVLEVDRTLFAFFGVGRDLGARRSRVLTRSCVLRKDEHESTDTRRHVAWPHGGDDRPRRRRSADRIGSDDVELTSHIITRVLLSLLTRLLSRQKIVARRPISYKALAMLAMALLPSTTPLFLPSAPATAAFATASTGTGVMPGGPGGRTSPGGPPAMIPG